VHGCNGGELGGGGCGGGRGCGGSCGRGVNGEGARGGGGGVGGDGGAAVHWSTSFCTSPVGVDTVVVTASHVNPAQQRVVAVHAVPAATHGSAGGGGDGGTPVPGGTPGKGGGGGGGKGECGGGGGLGLGGGGRAMATTGGGGGRGACDASTAEPSPAKARGAEPPSESSAGDEKSSQSTKRPPSSVTNCAPGVQKGRGGRGGGVGTAPPTSGLSSSRGVVSTVTGLTTRLRLSLFTTTTGRCAGGVVALGPGSTSGAAGTGCGDWFGRSRRSVCRSKSPLVAAGFRRHAVKDNSIAL